MFNDLRPDEPLLPSPLLHGSGDRVKLHFQYEPDGSLTSPQTPEGEKLRLAVDRFVTPEAISRAKQELGGLGKIVTRDALLSRLPERKYTPGTLVSGEMLFVDRNWASQGATNIEQYNSRSEAHKKAAVERKTEQMRANDQLAAPVDIREGPMTALWFGDTLVLARSITLDQREYIQGCVVDWPTIRGALATAGRDLLPNADFRPYRAEVPTLEGPNVQRLAALPIEVLPGDVPVDPPGGVSPLRVTLYVAWGCMALVALGMGFVLRRTLSLSARREEFVSAVTHELRTPLTTFRMYTEMLQSGRVKDDAARNEYYNTLHNEALRLGHLVENVLAYARLEGGRREDRIETLPLSRLLERATERVTQRAKQAGVQIELAACPDAQVRADPAAIEQILFNLVDNACKYAATGAPKIEIACETRGRTATISVRDHRPGISRGDAARLFQPFRKSAQAAANSAPGVGLGLALSRRLARAMGGELALDSGVRDGARFVLTLPSE
jgi:signal transduction histidine kinase